jgi:transposase
MMLIQINPFLNNPLCNIRETVAIFNISSHSTLHRWINQLEVEGEDALKPKKKGRQPVTKEKKPTAAESTTETLQAEVERLRMENAYLKKLNALVQNKEKSPNKTKHK